MIRFDLQGVTESSLRSRLIVSFSILSTRWGDTYTYKGREWHLVASDTLQIHMTCDDGDPALSFFDDFEHTREGFSQLLADVIRREILKLPKIDKAASKFSYYSNSGVRYEMSKLIVQPAMLLDHGRDFIYAEFWE